MRTLTTLVVVVLLATASGTGERPSLYKRGQLVHVCTPRDVKMMARFVCSLHRRSVLTLRFASQFYNRPPSRVINCGENGEDCPPLYDPAYDSAAYLLPPSGDVRTNLIKRDKEVVRAVGLTIADVRRKCCLNGCLPEDFYGACR
ncbi:uncharacterized protein LOC119594506 [Penaeus monodon]|uniref:uncharacterized protein LOC119594506 n=1 Tax=Penaeus monodon TaxID=6687 RepID=UPI0018A7D8A8|nr:uncharacterized protein LOC119594506 [Penaeus monodon]